MISAVVAVVDEVGQLRRCLESVKTWVDEIVVISLKPSLDLIEIANNYSAKVINHPFVDHVEEIREFSISHASGDWVLILDPDEEVSPDLSKELVKVANKPSVVAINIPRKNIFFGKWIAHSNYWPDRQIRFIKKKHVKWPKIIHAYPDIDGQVIDLPPRPSLALMHYGYASFSDFYSRQNRYSSVRANELFNSGQRFSVLQFVWQPLREFLVRYIKHLGFLDGYAGLFVVYSLMIYQLSIQVKLWQKNTS